MRGKVKEPDLIANLESRMYRDRARQALANNQIDRVKMATTWYEQGVNERPYSLLLKEQADLPTIDALAKVYVELGQQRTSEKMLARQEEIHRRYLVTE